jgi:hypothetical protein
MLDTTHTTHITAYSTSEQRPHRPRKIRLDCDLYRPHSVRASGGGANCDHDFEPTPTVREADFAVWKCTRCGRAFKYETWKSGARVAPKR